MQGSTDSQGRALIRELLHGLGILRVLFIDDSFEAGSANLEDISGRIDTIRPALAELIIQHPDLTDLSDDDLTTQELRSTLRRLWPDLLPVAQTALQSLVTKEAALSATTTVDGSETIDDAVANVDLRASLPDGVDLLQIPVTQWSTDHDIYFTANFPPTIVFFDRDLGKYGGRSGGDILLQKLLAEGHQSVYAGLFTHEATDAQQEIELANTLKRELASAVSVMAKSRTRDAMRLAEGLRVFLYTRDLESLRTNLKSAISDSALSATSLLDGLGYETLMASVEAARKEGLMEAHGPLRIARRRLGMELEQNLRREFDDTHSMRLRVAARQNISSVLQRSDEMTALLWQDRFDSAAHLAMTHLPLDVGDIFEFSDRDGAIEYYILLVQGCDLMVRPDGKRTNEPAAFMLARVVERPKGGQLGPKYVEVGPLHDTAAEWFVDLTKRMSVARELLDECVLTEDGSATFTPDSPPPVWLTEGWVKYARRLESWRAARVEAAQIRYQLLPEDFTGSSREQVEANLAAPLLGAGCADGMISSVVDTNSGTIRVGIRRFARLVPEHSRALLTLASQHQARPDRDGSLFRLGGQTV